MAGGAVGLGAAAVTVRVFRLIRFPTDMSVGYAFQFDGRMAVFGLATAIGSIVLFGLLPALHTARVEPMHYGESETRRFYDALTERARAVPGVKSVALVSSVPMQLFNLNAATLVPEGYSLPPGKNNVFIVSTLVDEHYFETMRIPLSTGFGIRNDFARRIGGRSGGARGAASRDGEGDRPAAADLRRSHDGGVLSD